MEYYAIKTNIIRYYLLPNFITQRLCNQKYEYEAAPV